MALTKKKSGGRAPTDAETRLAELVAEEREVSSAIKTLSQRLTEEERRNEIDELINSKRSVKDVFHTDATKKQLQGLLRQRPLLLGAIGKLTEEVSAEKAREGQRERARRKPEFESLIKEYIGHLKKANNSLGKIRQINADLHEAGFAPFPTVQFPGAKLGNFNMKLQDWGHILQVQGFNIDE
jgi:hypothetical protein